MPLLLKITDGLLKGAEVALLPGTRIKLGSDENGDIVIPDATMPSLACELDIADDECTLILPDGSSRAVPLFTIQTVNGLSFAIGPDSGAWEELKAPETSATAKTDEEPTEGESPAMEKTAFDGASDDLHETKPGNSLSITEAPKQSESPSIFKRFLLLVVLLVLLLAIAGWFILRHNRKAQAIRQETLAAELAARPAALKTLAEDYRLDLRTQDGRTVLKGNVKRRTERMALRALALAASPDVVLDLTDDQTLGEASDALLYTLTEGKVTLAAVADRSIDIAGEVADVNALRRILKAFQDDLPAVENISAKGVIILDQLTGGYVANDEKATGENASKEQAASNLQSTAETAEKEPPAVADANASPAPAADSMALDVSSSSAPRQRDYPVAGILTKPYPCVVLRNGTRCTIGGQLGNATIEKIEAECITLRENGRQILWKP